MKIDIVIVNWNAGIQLLECIESVIQYGQPFVGQVIVVDNGSTDDSERAVEKFSNVTLIRAGTNLGFGKACNLGASHSTADFLLFLNPDACLFANSLARPISFLLDPLNIAVGICGIQLIDENGSVARSCSRFPSVTRFIAGATGINRLFPKLGSSMKEWNHSNTMLVDQVIGAFFLVRRSVFEKLGGFDERFFVYFEEVDFSYRAKQLGWSSFYVSDARAFHAGGGTSDQVKAKRLFYSLRSRILYSFKHFTLWGAAVVLLSTIFLEFPSRLLQGLGRFSLTSMRETCTAYQLLCRWLAKWAVKRNMQ